MVQIKARRVSVVVPTCDRPAFLREALASIRALEGEDLTFEILVGDNGSASETQAIAEEFGAIYLRALERGAGAARNVALQAATGDYLAFLDDDDVWLSGNVRPQISILEVRPDLQAIIGQAISTDHQLRPIAQPWPVGPMKDSDDLLKKMLGGLFPQIGTAVARRSACDMIGEFDESLIGGQDLDWLLRLARRRCLGFVAVPCIFFRGRSISSDQLQRIRIEYDRRVFLRHAIPEWRIWRSPSEFLRAYSGTLMHFYRYFENAAVNYAAQRERGASFRAIVTAFRIFPLRASYHLISSQPLRWALSMCLFRTGSESKLRGSVDE
jgi:glycosyltransferase involved in cell wall biosynthesis